MGAVLTAEGGDGRVDGLDEHAFTVKLAKRVNDWQSKGQRGGLTSSQDFASSRIQPSSMTSAESFVTYTPWFITGCGYVNDEVPV